MKKKIAVMLVVCLIIGISGCGQKNIDVSTETTSNITDEETVLSNDNEQTIEDEQAAEDKQTTEDEQATEDKQTTEDTDLSVNTDKTEPSDKEPGFTTEVSSISNIPEGDTVLYETDFALNESRTAKIKLYGKKVDEYSYGISYVEFSWDNGSTNGFSTSEAVRSYWDDMTCDYTEAFEEDGGLMVGDYNFDGYMDIGLQAQTTAYNMPYMYWFYNADADTFDYYGSFLCFLEIDEISKECRVEYREAQTYYTDTYRPDGKNGLYLAKRDITEYIDGKETHRSETY